MEWHSSTDDKPSISGFVIDVFHAVQEALPFPLPHEFIPYMNKDRQINGTYDKLLYQIKNQVSFFLPKFFFLQMPLGE